MSVCQDKTRNRTSSLALCGGLDLARRDPAAMDAENSARLGPDQTVAECDGLPPEEEDDDAQGLSETYTIQSLDILEAILHMETRKHRCRRRLGAVVANIEKQATLFQQLCFKTLKEALVFFLVTRNVRLLNGPKEFVPQWLQLLTEVLEVERATIFLWDARRGELYSRCATGGLSQAIRLKSGSGIAGCVYATGQPVIVEKAYSHPRFNPIIDKRTNFRTRNICCVPLRLGDKVRDKCILELGGFI
ncbi:3'5'-cyclic nucleotide phosphodiesterase family protein, related [Neospora caninum Liverpool]|uniref:3'5'-cyclic nucleotide phosphodiesterase family protein, related n=1 Tax=Neospora caninum (strain Liverpool) TaxID=572307 RepID=F0VJX2_NEOCL|nr:3'5'-cyclic nucleotide phosphodiesterase family protein, related [Neospora caninum Liverpool]CBZ54034.1 3'5'-cyclic nucleotide phosphodiesterase family protein, related [Neospora caninum Liverpool]|eukprot:XP_003884065.1 3'5'-cyclic nucleotide phosphodiesterase family protein, related [Neospora caninum Liverpool]